MPTGIVEIVAGSGGTVAGTGATVAGTTPTVVGSTCGIGDTGGRPMFSWGNPAGPNAGATLMITVFPDRKPNLLPPRNPGAVTTAGGTTGGKNVGAWNVSKTLPPGAKPNGATG